MDHPKNYIQGNKEAWEEAFENRSPGWGEDVVQRLATEEHPFLRAEVVTELQYIDLAGKTVGQFCCNNGRELLSVMKQGASEGIGFDLAENQVGFANRTAAALHTNCRFVATDILEIDPSYDDKFDLLLITIGALCWFQDLSPFFGKVARCVKRGGIVLINEQHPVTNMLALPGEANYDENRPGNIVSSYFQNTWTENDGMFYMTQKNYPSKTFTSYTHSLSAIFTAAIESGLRILKFQEFEHDLSGGEFAAVEHIGIPLSYILRLKRPVED